MNTTRLPQVDKILREPVLVDMQDRFRRELLTELVREELSALRQESGESEAIADAGAIADKVAQRARRLLQPQLRKVINGTGVVLNTNLGRAPLSVAALQELSEVGSGYCNLEIDLATGKRGKRSQSIDSLLRLLTGAEASVIVNNNAAAVLLAVNAMARGKEVVVSRGELIEIGGSFRLPEVIESAGGILKEVGTTNRTRVEDFEKAINDRTGLLLRCHRSNFEITGFTEQVNLNQLVAVGQEHHVPVLEDLGSGVMTNLSPVGMRHEPTVRQVVETGCELICFSGDKLLGGPQAGIIVGKKESIERLAKHPLYRALRLDKLTLALLERSLIAYLAPNAHQVLPVLAMLFTPASDIKTRAEQFARTASDAKLKVECVAVATRSAAGGGSLPGEAMDSYGIATSLPGTKPNKLAEMLRSLQPPVIAIVQNDELIIDFRTVSVSDEGLLLEALKSFGRK